MCEPSRTLSSLTTNGKNRLLKRQNPQANLLMGFIFTSGGTRTLTVSPPTDFESVASTNSATEALKAITVYTSLSFLSSKKIPENGVGEVNHQEGFSFYVRGKRKFKQNGVASKMWQG